MNHHNLAYLSRILLVAFPIDIHNFFNSLKYTCSIIHLTHSNILLNNTSSNEKCTKYFLFTTKNVKRGKNEQSKRTRDLALLPPSSFEHVERHPEFRDPSATVGQAKH